MNCIKCYQEIPDGAKFCPYCGAQQSDTSATDPVRAEETVTEPVQAAQTEEVPTEPVQAAQTEEVPTEPVQAAQTEEALTEPVQPTQTEEAPTEPIQPEAASTDHVYQEAPAQETYTSAQNNPYYGTGQTYSDQTSDQQYGGNQGSDILPEPDALSESGAADADQLGTVPCIIYYLYVVLLSSVRYRRYRICGKDQFIYGGRQL